MIRDRLVVGIGDILLSERLQTDAALTLEKAKTVIRQREAVQEQQLILSHRENVDQQSVINYVMGKPFWRQGTAPHRPPALRPFQQASTASQRHSSKCKRVGRAHILDSSAQLKMQSATTAGRKDTAADSV